MKTIYKIFIGLFLIIYSICIFEYNNQPNISEDELIEMKYIVDSIDNQLDTMIYDVDIMIKKTETIKKYIVNDKTTDSIVNELDKMNSIIKDLIIECNEIYDEK